MKNLPVPSVSPAQKKLMNIAAHTKGGYGGVPQAVGKEFHEADKAKSRKKSTAETLYKDSPSLSKT